MNLKPYVFKDDIQTPKTLGELYLKVERQHDREAAFRSWSSNTWVTVPDWRFHRQIIRAALYLSERLKLREGDRALLMAPLDLEWLTADWAFVAQGIGVAVLDPKMGGNELRRAVDTIEPCVAFVSAAAKRALSDSGAKVPKTIVLDAPEKPEQSEQGEVSFSQIIELGGTFDTAERAQAFRERARAIPADGYAIAHADDSGTCRWYSHAEVIRSLERGYPRAKKGDVAHVALGARPSALKTHLELYAYFGDGVTSTTFGAAPELGRREEWSRWAARARGLLPLWRA